MSTFKGIVEEFPEILIDYFRTTPPREHPLAVFLSHVHSDHLQGLESFHGPFIYCSPATRELLLRLEKYPHRMNFAKGILETRKQHYKNLRTRLKAIPTNTPTEVELKPGRIIQVTLLDANHCVGAVMFLIEDTANAILYTGDIRAETWWINTLIRNPTILEYSQGRRPLNKIYLDTTFATKKEPYRSFPSKQEGLKELLDQVTRYPGGTIFHFNAWTFGYEEVWISLAKALGSQIHVDDYKYSLYKSLAATAGERPQALEGSALCGFKCANRYQSGCLTDDANVPLHSCERGMGCPALKASKVVWITPIIARTSQGPVPELGAGGGGGDLVQAHELMLDDFKAVDELLKLCSEQISEHETRAKIVELVTTAVASQNKKMSLATLGLNSIDAEIPLEKLAYLLSVGTAWEKRNISPRLGGLDDQPKPMAIGNAGEELPQSIQFPYSRHSSYDELCRLVEAFRPVDVYPCVVDEENWTPDMSIKSLFGHLCSGKSFAHDQQMLRLEAQRAALLREANEKILHGYSLPSTQRSVDSVESEDANTTSLDANATANFKRLPDHSRPRKRRRVSDVACIEVSTTGSRPVGIAKSNAERVPQTEAIKALEASFDAWLGEGRPGHAARSDTASAAEIPSFDGSADERPPYDSTHSRVSRVSYISLTTAKFGRKEFHQASDKDIRKSSTMPSDLAGNSDDNHISQAEISIPDSAFGSQDSAQSQASWPTQIRHRKEAYLAVKEDDGVAWRTLSPISSGNAHGVEVELN